MLVSVPFKETVVRGQVSSEHLVQLFDDPESLATAVAAFLKEGVSGGDQLLVVSTSEHWQAIAAALGDGDVLADQRIIWRDAAETLRQFMRLGRPDARLFDQSVGALVRDLASRSPRLRIYGEMVDLLAGQGDYRGAHELEELWNELAERVSFTLFCGYCAAHFGDPARAQALHAICRAHSCVRSDPRDLLSAFLLQSYTSAPA